MEFRILGPLEVWRDGARVEVRAPKQRALLALLLLRANEVVTQDELIDELWGEDAPPTARASLQNQIHALRRVLGADVLETQAAGYVLYVAPDDVDLARFERLLADARGAEPEQRAALLREALSEWRGLPLVEFPTEPFAQGEITRLEELRITALEDRIEADLALGRHAELVAELEGLVQRHPLRERPWGALMVALYRSGRQAEALDAYRQAHRSFVGQLGLEPGPALREIQRAILVEDVWLLEPDGARESSLLERAARLLPGSSRHRAELLLEYGGALWRVSERRQARASLLEAIRLAGEAGDRGLEERARLSLVWQGIFTDGTPLADLLAQAAQSATVFEHLGDDAGLALALRLQAHMLRDSGRAGEAARAAERGVDAARAAGDGAQEAWCRLMLVRSLAYGPTPVRDALSRCEEHLAALPPDASGPPDGGRPTFAYLLAQAGDIDSALAIARESDAAVRKLGDRYNIAPTAGMLASIEILAGRETAAISTLRACVELLESERDRGALGFYAAELARLLARRGDATEPERLVTIARAVSAADDFLTQVAWRRALAVFLARLGRAAEAVRLATEAVALSTASDWLTLQGETHEDHADVLALGGALDAAADALLAALAAYERKGNVVGRARAQGRLRELGA